MPQEYILKGVVNAAVGQVSNSVIVMVMVISSVLVATSLIHVMKNFLVIITMKLGHGAHLDWIL